MEKQTDKLIYFLNVYICYTGLLTCHKLSPKYIYKLKYKEIVRGTIRNHKTYTRCMAGYPQLIYEIYQKQERSQLTNICRFKLRIQAQLYENVLGKL